LYSSTYAEEYSWSLYCNLDKEAIKKGGFFPESAAGLLKSVIWFMKKKHPEHCTLPHIINIILNADTKTLVNMIISDVETKGMMKSVKEAAEKEAYDQLAGVVGSLTMQLQKINTPEICWVLTGDDFTLDLNNPNDPKFVVFGSLPELKSALSPVVAFISTIGFKLMNAQGKLPSAAFIDEGPTLFIPNLDSVPATARSNKLCVVYMAQDFSQMDVMYGKDNRKALVGNLAYQFYGNTSELETAKHVSEMVGEEYREIASHNVGGSSSESGESSSKGVSYSKQKRKIVEVQEMLTLKQGTFVGKLVESQNDWFKAPMKMISDSNEDFELKEIPKFVENFMLTSEEEAECKSKLNDLCASPEFIKRDKEFNILLNSKKYNGNLQNSEFINELETSLINRTLALKKNKVLDAYFLKIQDDVEIILNKYLVI
jgi:type IV secretory pathway TraG/TraD family ATPase VirD4